MTTATGVLVSCEICQTDLTTETGTSVCMQCTERIFPSCYECSTRVVSNWSESIYEGGFGSVSLQRAILSQLHRTHYWSQGVADGQNGPFRCVFDPVASFGAEFVASLERARSVSSGEFACQDCGHECDTCCELHETERAAEYCCDPVRQCETCGEWHEDEMDARRCCVSADVHCYSFRPTLRFFSGNEWTNFAIPKELYFGVELEMENVCSNLDAWYVDASEDYDNPTFAFWKEDGSLGSDGAELVTMPATLDAFRHVFPWHALSELHRKGARAFHTGTCGMHVHVARSAFSAPHMWRFVKLQTKNVGMCESIAQRPSNSWARWSSCGNVDDSGVPLPEYVKGKDANDERYVAINFQNHATVELRYFRGNLVPESITAKLEFVHAMWKYTQKLGVSDVRNGALDSGAFLAWAREHETEYATFVRFISERGI